MRILEQLSEVLYSFVMNTRANDYHFFQNGHGYGNGMEYLFIMLMLVPLVFCLYFYFVQAEKLENGTKKDYMTIFFIGLLTLAVSSWVVMVMWAGYKHALTSGNLWRVIAIDLLYYSAIYQLYSWLFKTWSNVRNLDLISCFSKK